MGSNDLDVQQAAMAGEAAKSSPDGEKARKSPIKGAYQAVLALIVAQRAAWAADEDTDDATREAVDGSLGKLADAVQRMHDDHEESAGSLGKHYVGVDAAGNRTHVQAVSVPTAKRFPSLVACYGPFSREIGATFRVAKGLQGNETVVFTVGK